MSKNLLILLIVFLLPCGSNAQKRKTLDEPSTIIYALPQTVLQVDVVAEKVVKKRGPFASYAEKYIGISNVVESDGVEWNLQSVSVTGTGEVDPEQYHKIRTSTDYEPGLIALTPEGLIRGFNLKKEQLHDHETYQVHLAEDVAEIEYGRFAIAPLVKYKEDTTYKVVETDTAFVKIPVLEKQAQLKTPEEKAEEAAHQLFKLRKRRFKILTANYEVLPPDGKAYEILVAELEKLEQDYLSLFIGKKISVQKIYQFRYAPKKSEKTGVLFRMSPQKGPVDVTDLAGKPIRVDFDNLGVTDELAIVPVTEANPQKQIAYRIPGKADVSISDGKNILFQSRMNIAQFGKIATMPAEVLLNENYSIEFYPNLGSIKNVSK